MKPSNELAEDTIHMLQSWSEAYPTDIFPEITQEDIDYINAVDPNLSARFFGHVGRHFIKKGFEPAIETIAELADRLAELELQLGIEEYLHKKLATTKEAS
jgi:hypothetical protein